MDAGASGAVDLSWERQEMKGRDNSEVRSLIRRFGGSGGGGSVAWGDLTGVPATFPPDVHALDDHSVPIGPVDFAQQQSQRFVIENRTSDPGAPVAGEIWLRTDL